MPRREETLQVAEQAFSRILAQFPHLQVTVDTNEFVELSVTLPVQPGLKYAVNLNLQNIDELHFSASHFWLEWFPCTDTKLVNYYVEDVSGFLSGEYRIVEHYRGARCVKAELQSPREGWHTIGTWSTLFIPIPWEKKHTVLIQNK